VDAVGADPPSGHHHQVAGTRALLLARTSRDLDRKRSDRAAEDERLAEVPVVEQLPAAAVGDAALIAAVDHPVVHAVADPARVEEPRGDRAVVEGRAEAVAPDVDQQVGPEPRAERVAVDPHDAGDGAAVGIQGGRGVVGLDLVDEVAAVVEGDHARVVVEDRDQPGSAVALAKLPVDLARGLPDVGVEEGTHALGVTPRLLVVDGRVEDLVLAVFAPGLGQTLEFGVGRLSRQPQFAPPREPLGRCEVVADRPHLGDRQGEQPLTADPGQCLVAHVEIDALHRRHRPFRHAGDRQVGRSRAPLVVGTDGDGLDDGVGEQFDRDPLGLRAIDPAQEVDAGAVDGVVVAQGASERVLDGDPGALAHGVGDPGLVAHAHRDVEGLLFETAQGAALQHRVRELLQHAVGLGRRQFGLDVVDVATPHPLDLQAEVGADTAGHGLAAWVDEFGAGGDLDPGDHGASVAARPP